MLLIEPWYFANVTDTMTGTPAQGQSLGTATGVSFGFGASSADGTAVTLLSPLAHDVELIELWLSGSSIDNIDTNALADLLVDPAGGTAWAEVVADLACGFQYQPLNSFASMLRYTIPLKIAAGSSVGLRAKFARAVANPDGFAHIACYGNPSRPDAHWAGTKVETLGASGAGSKGTDITPGDSGAWGSWINVGSPTTARYGALIVGINGSDTTATNVGMYFEVGYGSTPLPGCARAYVTLNTAEAVNCHTNFRTIQCDIPEGTQLQMRATQNSTGTRVINTLLYGVS